MQEDNKRLQKEKEELAEERDAIANELVAIKGDLVEANKKNEQLESEIEKMKQNSMTKVEFKKVDEEATRLKRSVEKQKAKLDEQTKEIATLISDREKAKKSSNDSAEQVRILTAKVTSLKDDKKKLRQKNK